jgi:hypothetical protein
LVVYSIVIGLMMQRIVLGIISMVADELVAEHTVIVRGGHRDPLAYVASQGVVRYGIIIARENQIDAVVGAGITRIIRQGVTVRGILQHDGTCCRRPASVIQYGVFVRGEHEDAMGSGDTDVVGCGIVAGLVKVYTVCSTGVRAIIVCHGHFAR